MKKTLFVFLLSFYFFSCNNESNKVQTPAQTFDLTECKTTKDDVKKMLAQYLDLIVRDQAKLVREVNLDTETLKKLLDGTTRLRLIPCADDAGNVTIFLEFLKGDKHYYCDIKAHFNASQPGMEGREPICPPLTSCEFNIAAKGGFVEDTTINEMAADSLKFFEVDPEAITRRVIRYIDRVEDDPVKNTILLTTMGSKKLLELLGDSKRLTIVYGTYQFWPFHFNDAYLRFKEDDYSKYYGITKNFGPDTEGMEKMQAICPPPKDPCDVDLLHFAYEEQKRLDSLRNIKR